MQFNPALKQTFLYRLFVHSKTGFGVVLFILIFYSVTFSKRMGMIFFPYNNMFTVDFTKTNQAFTYGVKINGEMIPITGYLYWKKDFLESSLTTYVEYIENGYTLYLESYLKSKRAGNSIVKNLLPLVSVPIFGAVVPIPISPADVIRIFSVTVSPAFV